MPRRNEDRAPESPTADALREARERFVALWGQMGSTWGIPRTMAQVHALLFIAGEPLNTDEVMEGLGISRGNASMTLRGLVDWGIVSRVHRRGDRKEYFVAEQDVWKMFRTILAERKKRELDPLREELSACRGRTERIAGRKLDSEAAKLRAHNDRLDRLIEFMRIVDSISQRFSGPGGKGLEMAAKLLDRAS
ncbi:MAG: MarR family transcriptional regulator [Planctomycetes bacterium]|nr:MarR family transcriptional regulator [Planctomycetota bacterium]